jgi:hypothetical protein
MGDSFREHGVMLYLDKTSYKAFIRPQADKGLGRSFAELLPFIEGLHHMGYLTDPEHEERVKKYSQPLCEEARPLTTEQVQQKSEVANWEKRFSLAIKEWSSMPEKSQVWHVQKAKELLDGVPNAKLVLALANGGQP